MHYKTSNCIGSLRYSVNTKLPGAVFKFQMLLNVIWKNVVIRHRFRPDWATTTFACRLHILSRPGGCQSLMTEVYYILPNKVTKCLGFLRVFLPEISDFSRKQVTLGANQDNEHKKTDLYRVVLIYFENSFTSKKMAVSGDNYRVEPLNKLIFTLPI